MFLIDIGYDESSHHPWHLKHVGRRRRYAVLDGIIFTRDIPRYIEFDAQIRTILSII